jgi:hypothetical protein
VTHVRIYWSRRGGHIHCEVFSAPAADLTHALNGTLIFSEREWPDVQAVFAKIADMRSAAEDGG